MSVLIYLFLIVLVGIIPFDLFFPWVFKRSEHISSKLDNSHDVLFFSKAILAAGLERVVSFLKGYGAIYLGFYFFGESLWVLFAFLLMSALHLWSPFRVTPGQFNLHFVIWGAYTVLFWPLLIVYPILFCLFSFLLNSFLLGTMVNIVSVFFVFWYFESAVMSLPLNFFVFILALVSLSPQMFRHFEVSPYTILRSYQRRNRGRA
jgi:hypothetical protein